MAEFESINLAELEEEQAGLAAEGGSAGGNNDDILKKFVKMPQGDGYIILRLLPPTKGSKFYQETRVHKLDNGKMVRNIHCPRTKQMLNGKRVWLDVDRKHPCPVCKYYSELWKEADEAEKNGDNDYAEKLKSQARAIKPVERYYYNSSVAECYPEIQDQEYGVPKILSIGKTLHNTIVTNIVGDPKQKLPALGDVTHPKNGRNFKIVKKMKVSGKDKYPDYGKSDFEDPTPLGSKEEVDAIMDNLHNLSELRRIVDHDEIKLALKKYLGLVADENDTDFDMNEYRGMGGSTQSIEEQLNAVVNNSPGKTVVTKSQPANKSSAMRDLMEEKAPAKSPVKTPVKSNPVTSQASEDLGGSGNNDELLSDDDFLKTLNDI